MMVKPMMPKNATFCAHVFDYLSVCQGGQTLSTFL